MWYSLRPVQGGESGDASSDSDADGGDSDGSSVEGSEDEVSDGEQREMAASAAQAKAKRRRM